MTTIRHALRALTATIPPIWLAVGAAAVAVLLVSAAVASRAAAEGRGPGADAAANLIGTTTPSVFAVVHNGSHAVVTTSSAGSPVHVQVTVSGPKGNPTGPTITVSRWANATCTGTAAATFRAGISNGLADGVAAMTPMKATTISFRAHFPGDASYAVRDSSCISLKITKINAVASGVVHDGLHATITTSEAGRAVHFQAKVVGKAGTPTGDVVVQSFPNGTCSGGPVTGNGATLGANGIVDIKTGPGMPYQLKTLGPRSFHVYYAGNGTYNAGTGPCLAFTVTKARSEVGSSTHNGLHKLVSEILPGGTLHPVASVGGFQGMPAPTGRIQTMYWNGEECIGTPAIVGERLLLATTVSGDYASGTADAAGPSVSRSAPAVVSYRIHYDGDALYKPGDGACVKMRWKPAATLSGSVHNANHATIISVPAGTSVHARATASGSFGPVSGMLSVGWFTGANCASANAAGAESFAFAGVLDTPWPKTPVDPGQHSFRLTLSKSPTYLFATTCVNFTVVRAPATLTAGVHNGAHDIVGLVAVESSVHGFARVTGAAGLASGTITFKAYTNATCSGDAVTTTRTLSQGAAEAQYSQLSVSVANWSWRMSYSGSSRYLPATGSCVVVGWRAVALWGSVLHDPAHHSVTTVTLGTRVHVDALLASLGVTVKGDVTTRVFANGTCSGSGTNLGTYALSGGMADPAGGFTTAAAGLLSFRVSYSGNSEFLAANGPCMPLTVVALSPPPPPG